ncbi:hypothetical protein TNCV_1901811 [Trichonephila clavipes]|nr:hypothetical protein TNCV_1901811 [Trichonephila clavipes]
MVPPNRKIFELLQRQLCEVIQLLRPYLLPERLYAEMYFTFPQQPLKTLTYETTIESADVFVARFDSGYRKCVICLVFWRKLINTLFEAVQQGWVDFSRVRITSNVLRCCSAPNGVNEGNRY